MQGLRLAIDCLPAATREAMLRGVRASERVIAGAYVDGEGGVCPMLAAHRCGGRTDFLSFARSWDRFAGAQGRPREATRRELAVLISQLEASIAEADGLQFDEAIADHRRLLAASRRRRRLLEAIDPRGEISARRLAGRRDTPVDGSSRAPLRRLEWPVSARV